MRVTVTSRHLEMTDALRAHVDNSLAQLRNHFDKVIDVSVTLRVERYLQVAEVNLHANGLRVHATARSEDMYASIDQAVAKIDKQLLKFKHRIMRHQPRTSREERNYIHHVIEMPFNDERAEPDHGAAPEHTIVHRETLSMKPMLVDEALLQLELQEDSFLAFANAETNRVNVVYKRGDGTYGLIEPPE